MSTTTTSIDRVEQFLDRTKGIPINGYSWKEIREMRELLHTMTAMAKLESAMVAELGALVPLGPYLHAVHNVSERAIADLEIAADFGAALSPEPRNDFERALDAGLDMVAIDREDCGSCTIDFSDVIGGGR